MEYTHDINEEPSVSACKQSRLWMVIGVCLTLLFHGFYAAWLHCKPISAQVTHLGDDVLETLGAIFAALFCFLPASRLKKKPFWTGAYWRSQETQIAWFCGLSMLCYALQQVYLVYPDFTHQAAPVSAATSDTISLLSYPLLLLGLWRLPRRPLSVAAQVRIGLDGLMVILSALTFSWYFVLGPVVLYAKGTLEARIVSALYPSMDIFLAACLLLLGGRTGYLRSVLRLIAAGLIVVIVSDSTFSYISLHWTFASGTLLDICWSLGFMLIGVGVRAGRQAMDFVHWEEESSRLPSLLSSLLPYALLPFVCALVIYTEQSSVRAVLKHGIFLGALTLICVILARQVLALLENRELNGRLEGLATTDPLTGLLNHRTFHKRLAEAAALAGTDGQTLAVAMLDLDNFKFFNDAYGHAAGDDVLRQVAHALRECTTEADIIGRFGGDEFALILPITTVGVLRQGLSASGLQKSLEASLNTLSFCPPGSSAAIPMSISVGIATLPEEASTALGALELADNRLMYRKTGGSVEHPSEQLCHELTLSHAGFSMLNALVTAVDNKDRYTRHHSEDVLTYSLQIADQLGLDPETRRTVQIAALLHDVGKIGVPDRILRKPGVLTEDEFEAVKQHPFMGAIIVGAVPGFEETLDAVRHHHERWDGKGYPFGLAGAETPFLARLIAVADAFSAMTTDRPYRKGMDRRKALSILENGAGTQWDPECVHALLRVYRRSAAIPAETRLLAA